VLTNSIFFLMLYFEGPAARVEQVEPSAATTLECTYAHFGGAHKGR
jgi:hypothetical protein